MRKKFHFKLLVLFFCFGLWNTLNAQIIEVNSIKCFGDQNGELSVIANFGTAPYTYAWSSGQTTQNIDGLAAANYTVTVTESGLATQIYNYQLNQPQPITATYTITPNSSWPINSGSILINQSGGTAWYDYTIYDSTSHVTTNQHQNPLFVTLASGAFNITVTDLYGCKFKDIVHVPENAAMAVLTSIDTTACYLSTAPTSVWPSLSAVYPVIVNLSNTVIDTIKDTVMGNRPYVMITPGDTFPNISGQFAPGFHIMTIYAADGKGFRYSWEVDSVLVPVIITWTNTNDICFGDHTASISTMAQGSYNSFTYSITGPKGFSTNSSSAGGLYAGEYVVTATDFTGCSKSQGIFVSQPDEPIHIVYDDPIKPRCPFSADGAVSIHLIDGVTAPITYKWSTGDNAQGIDSLYPGDYYVTVTDANNCSLKDSIKLLPDRRSCIFNIITPNGDGFNDFLDLTDICKGMTMKAEVFNESGTKVVTFDETNPRWDPSNVKDPANPPTGTASTYTVFIELTKNAQPYMKWAESFSVIYPK